MSSETLKILFIEDNEDDYIAVRDMLAMVQEPQFQVVWVSSYEEAITCLSWEQESLQVPSGYYDACLLDYHLGEHTGLEILQHTLSSGHQIPIILLTGEGTRDIDRQALEMGAASFLAKDEISPASLERTIRYAIKQKQMETLLRQSQEVLAQSNASLEEKITEQSAELEYTREQEAYLRQLQTKLLASVSHEFRTPLMAIQGSAELLEECPDEANTAFRFQRIYAGVERITKTLDNTLIYAALEAGSIPFIPVPIHLDAVCQDLVANLQQFVDKGQELQFINRSSLTTPVPIDVRLVQLMLTHLILNAIRYAPDSGSIQLELNYNGDNSGNPSIVFQVRDRGIGIPSDELEKVFDGYYRASNADLIAGTPGIGIGLAIVKRAAILHGGSVSLASEVDTGTTATLSLPIIQPVS